MRINPASRALIPLTILQVKTEEEGDAEGGGIVEEGREVGEGKDAIVAQQDDIEQGIGGTRLDVRKRTMPIIPASITPQAQSPWLRLEAPTISSKMATA